MLTSKRLEWLDAAKGYGILLILFAHTADNGLTAWMYSFHVPLFFLLSGYTCRTDRDFADFAARKAKGLLLPYVLYGIPLVLIAFWQYSMERAPVLRYLQLLHRYTTQTRLWTIWFFPCLFFLSLIFYGAVRLLRTERRLALLSVLLCVLGLLQWRYAPTVYYWNIDVCLVAFPFFFAGYWYRNHRKEGTLPSVWKIGLLLGVNLLLALVSMRLSGERLDLYESAAGIPWLSLPAALTGSFAAILFAQRVHPGWVQYIGRHSLLYCAWHQALVFPFVQHGLQMCPWLPEWTVGLLKGLTATLILTVLAFWFDHIRHPAPILRTELLFA